MGPFIHNIDPIILEIGGIYLWWYGLSYCLGFLGIYLWFLRSRDRLNMDVSNVYKISLYFTIGVLIGGRFVEVVFYEWEYFTKYPLRIFAYWTGGMATHGLLLGAILATLIFCWRQKKNFLTIMDELVIPGAFVMGVGRIGNFIDGQISGSITEVWWAVQFPDLEGFRHPVVLYDGLKNLLLVPFLIYIRRSSPRRGIVFAHFIFWYAFLRIFIDVFREYRVDTLELGTGQIINIAMSLIGLILMIWFYRSGNGKASHENIIISKKETELSVNLWPQRILFGFLLLFCLVMPSDWTQDIPERYGKRHPGLKYSTLYPRIEERLPERKTKENKKTVPEY